MMNPLNYLDDKQIADVLNYIRNSWGNKYPAVMPAQVKAERK
jgi:mono/diheme cytochrome c family protein